MSPAALRGAIITTIVFVAALPAVDDALHKMSDMVATVVIRTGDGGRES